MNGTNLHETGVRQMGRVEGGGERQGEEKEEWLLKRVGREGKQTQG